MNINKFWRVEVILTLCNEVLSGIILVHIILEALPINLLIFGNYFAYLLAKSVKNIIYSPQIQIILPLSTALLRQYTKRVFHWTTKYEAEWVIIVKKIVTIKVIYGANTYFIWCGTKEAAKYRLVALTGGNSFSRIEIIWGIHCIGIKWLYLMVNFLISRIIWAYAYNFIVVVSIIYV